MYNSRLYNIVRLLAGLLTLVALLGHYYLPKKTLLLVPSDKVFGGITSDGNEGGPSRVTWIDQEKLKSLCQVRFRDKGSTHCAMSLSWGLPTGKGLDFSSYEGFRIKLDYQGSAERIRLFMRNYNPAFSTPENQNSAKFISMWIRTNELKDEVFVRFTEFTVADWWLTEFNLSRDLTPPKFNNIVAFGVDFYTEGDHQVELESLEFVGDWVETETLLLIIILIWMTLVFWEGLSRLYLLNKKQRMNAELINELVDSYSKLEVKKEEFENLSKRDALTGLLNRHGLQSAIAKLFANDVDKLTSTVIIFDIDHFKRVNDRRGHDAGDAVLEQLSGIFLRNTRQGDIVGRWGGEEFMLVCKDTNIYNGLRIAEKLRETVASHRFSTASGELLVTASLGVASVKEEDSFEQAFKRADEALYLAKGSGRNCVMSELDLES